MLACLAVLLSAALPARADWRVVERGGANNMVSYTEAEGGMLAALKSALATAKAMSAPTQADVATLQAALEAFNAVYPDASDLEAEIAAAQALSSGVPIRNGVSGYYSTEAANTLNAAISATQGLHKGIYIVGGKKLLVK